MSSSETFIVCAETRWRWLKMSGGWYKNCIKVSLQYNHDKNKLNTFSWPGNAPKCLRNILRPLKAKVTCVCVSFLYVGVTRRTTSGTRVRVVTGRSQSFRWCVWWWAWPPLCFSSSSWSLCSLPRGCTTSRTRTGASANAGLWQHH